MNNLEQQIDTILIQLGFDFHSQYHTNGKILDFADPLNKIAIEVQGTYWHGHPLSSDKNKRKKQAKNHIKLKQLEKVGWKIITIWEHSIKRNPNKVKKHLEQEILKRMVI